MDIRIKATAEPRTLILINPWDRSEWAEDFIFQMGTNAFWDDEFGFFWMDFSEFILWEKIIQMQQEFDIRCYELTQRQTDPEVLKEYVRQNSRATLFNHSDNLHRILGIEETEHP